MGGCGCVCSKEKEEASRALLPGAFAPLHTDINFKYRFLKTIGTGRYGKASLAALKVMPSAQVVIKALHKKRVQVTKDTLEREIQTLFKFDHPYIARLFEVFEDSESVYLVTEHCSGEGLFEAIVAKGKFPEQEACGLIYKILLVVNHLHHLNVVHRDLKPENFMFEDTSPTADLKLIDFGLSNKIFAKMDHLEQKTIVGTPDYMAPETAQGGHGPMCDLWSVGVIMYAMLSGQLPFTALTPAGTLERVMAGNYSVSSETWNKVSPQAIDLIGKLLVVDPRGRLTAATALKHDWFSQAPIRQPVSVPMLDALRNYKTKTRFQAEAHRIITKFVNLAHSRDVKSTFLSLNKDNSGYLSSDEVRDGLREAGHTLEASEMEEILRNVNFKQDGRISYSDFLSSVMIPRALLDDDMLWCAFIFFDVDNTGVVDEGKVKEALQRVGRSMSQDEVHEMLITVEAEELGVDYGEFKKVVLQGSAAPRCR